jgi:hypothetical protein
MFMYGLVEYSTDGTLQFVTLACAGSDADKSIIHPNQQHCLRSLWTQQHWVKHTGKHYAAAAAGRGGGGTDMVLLLFLLPMLLLRCWCWW